MYSTYEDEESTGILVWAEPQGDPRPTG
jgi:hypothetical protein